MFNIGMSEMLIILGVALLVFGPDKLPDVAKKIAKGLKEVRRASDDLRSTLSANLDVDEERPRFAPPRREAAPPHIQGSALNDEPKPSSVVLQPAAGTLAQGHAVDEPPSELPETSETASSETASSETARAQTPLAVPVLTDKSTGSLES